MDSEQLGFQDIVERVTTIPSLPEVARQVGRLVNDPGSSARDIQQVMIRDPGMAAKVLRLANSPALGLRETVRDLEQAIAMLGFKTIRSIAMSISVLGSFQIETTGFDMQLFWKHATVCAHVSRMIAERARIGDPELAYLGGLLKDLGLLILVEYTPEELARALRMAEDTKCDLHVACRAVLGTDHAEIGGWLCRHWRLEEQLVDVVEHQYRLEQAAEKKLVATLAFTEHLLMLKRIRLVGDHGQEKIAPEVWQLLGLDKQALVEALSTVNDEVDRARQVLAAAKA